MLEVHGEILIKITVYKFENTINAHSTVFSLERRWLSHIRYNVSPLKYFNHKTFTTRKYLNKILLPHILFRIIAYIFIAEGVKIHFLFWESKHIGPDYFILSGLKNSINDFYNYAG